MPAVAWRSLHAARRRATSPSTASRAPTGFGDHPFLLQNGLPIGPTTLAADRVRHHRPGDVGGWHIIGSRANQATTRPAVSRMPAGAGQAGWRQRGQRDLGHIADVGRDHGGCLAATSASHRRETCSAKWQATTWPAPHIAQRRIDRSTQFSGLPSCSRSQQRVWKRQPDGGCAGDGTSPLRTRRFLRTRGSGSGMAESRATVYGWRGLAVERRRRRPARRACPGT